MPKQTGPRTGERKSASSQNSRQHGLSTANIIVSVEEQPFFDQMEAELRDEIQPAGPLEDLAFRRLTNATWQMERSNSKPSNSKNRSATSAPSPSPNQQLARRNPPRTRSVNHGLPLPPPRTSLTQSFQHFAKRNPPRSTIRPRDRNPSGRSHPSSLKST